MVLSWLYKDPDWGAHTHESYDLLWNRIPCRDCIMAPPVLTTHHHTHVDDFLWACTESGHAVVDLLLTRFELGRKEEGRLRFCGKQFDASGHDILLDVKDNTGKTTYIEIAKHRSPGDPVTTGEGKQP